jgi:Phage integrase, N-terminal SAM-like domain
VFRRSDGKWRGVLDLGWTDGRRTRRWVFGATEREVLAKLAELWEAQRRGQNLSARRYTFGQWLEEWLSVKRRQGTRASTLRGYEWLIRQHIRPGLGGIRLDKLTPTDIRHLVERKAESGLSAQSVRLMHALILTRWRTLSGRSWCTATWPSKSAHRSLSGKRSACSQ